MKLFHLITTLWLASMVCASAQQTFSSSQELTQPSTGKIAPQLSQPVPLKPFAPQGSGVIYEMSEKGLVIISPVAPKEYGYGEKFLTRNPFPGQLAQDQANERRFDYGGIKLIGFDF